MLTKFLFGAALATAAFLACTIGGHAAPASKAVSNAVAKDCPGFEGNSAAPEALDRYYAQRAISLVRQARAGNADAITPLVAPDARFLVVRGDATSSARSRGPSGAIEMAKDLDAASFEARATRRGTAMLTSVECEWAVEVLFRTVDADRAVAVQFSFRNGRLQGARGQEVQMIEGKLR